MCKTTWTPTEGQRAWCGDRNCDVMRIFEKSKTATVQFWGSGLLEGKIVTRRGVRLSSLSEPRKFIGSGADGRAVYVECCKAG